MLMIIQNLSAFREYLFLQSTKMGKILSTATRPVEERESQPNSSLSDIMSIYPIILGK